MGQYIGILFYTLIDLIFHFLVFRWGNFLGFVRAILFFWDQYNRFLSGQRIVVTSRCFVVVFWLLSGSSNYKGLPLHQLLHHLEDVINFFLQLIHMGDDVFLGLNKRVAFLWRYLLVKIKEHEWDIREVVQRTSNGGNTTKGTILVLLVLGKMQ